MKSLDQYTSEELAELTEEDIKALVDRESAKRGLPLDIEEPVRPASLKAKFDLELAEVKGFTCDRDTARRVQEILNRAETILFDTPYTNRGPAYAKPIARDSYHWPEIKLLSIQSELQRNREDIEYAVNKKQWENYNLMLEEYEEANIKRSELIDEVVGLVRDAQHEKYRKERMQSEFDRYMKLADNNREVAVAFFKERYGNDVEVPEAVAA